MCGFVLSVKKILEYIKDVCARRDIGEDNCKFFCLGQNDRNICCTTLADALTIMLPDLIARSSHGQTQEDIDSTWSIWELKSQ